VPRGQISVATLNSLKTGGLILSGPAAEILQELGHINIHIVLGEALPQDKTKLIKYNCKLYKCQLNKL